MATRKKLSLFNQFHASGATVIALDGTISLRAMGRASRKLCGISTCRCGWNASTRAAYDAAGNRYLIHPGKTGLDAFEIEPEV